MWHCLVGHPGQPMKDLNTTRSRQNGMHCQTSMYLVARRTLESMHMQCQTASTPKFEVNLDVFRGLGYHWPTLWQLTSGFDSLHRSEISDNSSSNLSIPRISPQRDIQKCVLILPSSFSPSSPLLLSQPPFLVCSKNQPPLCSFSLSPTSANRRRDRYRIERQRRQE